MERIRDSIASLFNYGNPEKDSLVQCYLLGQIEFLEEDNNLLPLDGDVDYREDQDIQKDHLVIIFRFRFSGLQMKNRLLDEWFISLI